MRNNELNIDKPSEFIDELWDKLTSSGLYAYSKNDIYDYLIYLLNKYDEKHFFDTNSNASNSRLLKVSQTRIKTVKTNISVKFMDEKEYDEIFVNFLNNCASSVVKFDENIGNGKIKFVIENPAIKAVLEAKLKSAVSDTLDYSFNKEIVTIDAKNFIETLNLEYENLNNSENLTQTQKILKNKLQKMKINEILKKLKDMAENITVGVLAEIVASPLKGFFGILKFIKS